MAVGGSGSFANDEVGTGLANSGGTQDNLIVGGSLSISSTAVDNGNVVYGTTISQSGLSTPNGTVRQDSVINFSTEEQYLTTASSNWAQEAVNGTTTFSSGTLTLTGTSSSVNVFHVTSTQLSEANQITISGPINSQVLIDVTGTSIAMANVEMTLVGVDRQGVLWNFSQATAISMAGISQFDGSILAPYASVSSANVTVDGTLVCNNLSGAGDLGYFPLVISCPTSVSAPYTVVITPA